MNEEECLTSFLKEVKKRDISPKTKYGYDQGTRKCLDILRSKEMKTRPDQIGEREIKYLKDVAFADLEVRTKRWYLTMLNGYLQHFDNYAMDKMKLRWPQDCRVYVDWLTPDDAKKLLSTPMTIQQELVVKLELCMGLRRVEVIRLTVDKITPKKIDVRGKGRSGGKWRSIPYSPGVYETIQRYLKWRSHLISEVQRYNPRAVVPDEVFIYAKGNTLKTYGEKGTGFDAAFIHPLRVKSGIKFSNHTLRRTFGRTLWKNGIPIETISEILGHESTDVTLDYIGVNIDDMTESMAKLEF